MRIGKANIAPNHLAPLVLQAFELIASRLYSTDVVRLLIAEKGLLSKDGNPIARSYFFRLLKTPLYKGVIEMFGVSKQGSFEPIVPAELFDKVQAILRGRKNDVKQYLKENPDFPLRRFLKNEEGKPLAGYWAKGKTKYYPYYSFGLTRTTIRKEALEEEFIQLLRQLSFDTAQIKLLKDSLEKKLGAQVEHSGTASIAIEKRIVDLNEQINKYLNLLTENTPIKRETIMSRIDAFERELEQLNDELRTNKAGDFDFAELVEETVEILKSPDSFWRNTTPEKKKLFQEFVFPKGLIWNGKILRTPKICSVFSLNCDFRDMLSPDVNLRVTEKNTLQTDTFTSTLEDNDEKQPHWEAVGNDLAKIRSIASLDEQQA